MTNKLKHFFLLGLVLWLSACGQNREDSKTKVVNGSVVSPDFFSDDSSGLPFLLGFHLASAKTKIFSGGFCSGFRYGYQTLVTAAHCIEEQFPAYKTETAVIELTTGTGKPLIETFFEVEILVHPDYTPGCIKLGTTCPDLAIIRLPDSLASLDIWRTGTDPAEIDLGTSGFPAGQAPMIAGFGCTEDDFYISGSCARPTFNELRFSVATEIIKKAIPRQDLGPNYFQVEGSNSIGKTYGIGQGDSGAPLFRFLPRPRTLQPGDLKKVIVDGIGIYIDTGFVESLGYDNIVLDFGRPDISQWLSEVLVKDGLNFRDPTLAVINPNQTRLCNPDLISSKSTDQPFAVPNWTQEKLGPDVPPEVIKALNNLVNQRTRLYLGQCIGYVERKVAALEKLGPSHPQYDELSILYQATRWELFMLLEIVSNQQQLNREEQLLLEELHKLQAQAVLEMTNVVLSGTPIISAGYDFYILYTGENITGPVSEFEYNLTAAMVLVPGIIKGTGKALEVSAKTLESSARVAASLGKYGAKAGRISLGLSNAAKSMQSAHAGYLDLIKTAKDFGIQTSEGVRSFLRLRRALEPACPLFTSVSRPQPNLLRDILLFPLQAFESKAYASENCGDLTIKLVAALQKNFPALEEASLDSLAMALRKACGEECGLEKIIKTLNATKDAINAIGPKKFSGILRTTKGSRPDPKLYLPKEYIDSHLAKFEDGATRFMTRNQLDRFGPAQVDGTSFFIPKQEADKILANAADNRRSIEESLGLPAGFLDDKDLMRIDISSPRSFNARIPSGNEAGVNDLWLPGGKLPNGNSEAILDLGSVPPGTWTSSKVEL